MKYEIVKTEEPDELRANCPDSTILTLVNDQGKYIRVAIPDLDDDYVHSDDQDCMVTGLNLVFHGHYK